MQLQSQLNSSFQSISESQSLPNSDSLFSSPSPSPSPKISATADAKTANETQAPAKTHVQTKVQAELKTQVQTKEQAKATAQLKKISNSTLLDEVKSLARREKAITAQVIEYLKEIDSRKLFLECGYPSLFAFAVGFLGYSEAEAQIRICAARLSQALPEVPALVESGKLSLSVVAAAQSSFRKENQKRKEEAMPLMSAQEKRSVIAELEGAGRRRAEQILSAKFEGPKSRSITIEISEELQSKIDRLLDLMAHKNFSRNLATMLEILVEQELAKYDRKLGVSNRDNANENEGADIEKKANHNEDADIEKKANHKVGVDLQANANHRDRVNGQANLDSETEITRQHQEKQKFRAIHLAQQSARARVKLQNKESSPNQQMDLLGDSKAPNAEKANPIESKSAFLNNKSRYIPQATRRLVWAKHKGKCTYQDPRTGKQCGSTHGIQIDHARAFSRGGTHEPNNLTLLCASHNSWKGAR